MEHKLKDFIKLYDNVIQENICNSIINFFESNAEKHEVIKNQKRPNFTQLNFTQNCKSTKESFSIHNYLGSKIVEYRNIYYKDIKIDNTFFPKQHSFEEFRIKKYLNNGEDEFDIHVDVTDYPSSRRFLSFLLYLNDVENGGETLFDDVKILPKQGSMVVFPPLWLFPHKGNAPLSNSKYIMSTYLHYI